MLEDKIRIEIKGNELVFGVVSDTHLGSKSDRVDLLEEAYEHMAKEGIKIVFHAGDISDGIGVYKGQERFLRQLDTHGQARYVIKKYPKRKGIDTYFICGNHDLRQFERNGEDIGYLIEDGFNTPANAVRDEFIRGRDDLHYLGRFNARVGVYGSSGRVNVDLVHPNYGWAYALSYPLQKYINELEGGSKPNILLFGHLHRSLYMDYRNIHAFMAGAFQDQNDFYKRMGVNPCKGHWEVRLRIDGHSVRDLSMQWHKSFK